MCQSRRSRLALQPLEDRTTPVAGTMDTSFGGGDGIVKFNLPGFFTVDARGVAVQPDGKTVIAGRANSSSDNHAIVYRLNIDGTLDTTFSGDGFTTTQFGGATAHFDAVALQPDGKIVATGTVRFGGQFTVVTARFNPDGSSDLLFGTNGFVSTDFTVQEEHGQRVLVQPDGKVVVVGNANGIAFLLRYTTAGVLDTEFSLDGVFQFQTGGGGAFFRGAALQPDGKIVAAGHGSPTGSPARGFLLVRVNADGTLDNSFDADGSTVTLIPGADFAEGYGVAVLPDGRIAAVGAGVVSGGQHVAARYLANGSLDTTFDTDGSILLQYQPEAQGGILHAVAADHEGRIVAAGYTAFPHNGVVMRFREDGAPDTDFGVGNFRLKPGVVFTHAGGGEEIYDLTILPNGRIVTAGKSDGNLVAIRYFGENDLAVADQYMTSEDTSLSVGAPGVMANDILQPGGSREVALVQGPAHGSLTLNADGSLNYTPAANYNGPDSFTYTLVEGGFSSNTVTVFLTVQPLNDPPTAADDAYGFRFHSPLTVSAADGVLKNDADTDGNTLHAILLNQPAEGSVVLNDDGSFVFTHPDGMTGVVTFTYKVNDGIVDGPTVTVTLFRAPNAPPTAVNDAYALEFASPLIVSAADGVLKNDSDADAEAFTATLVTPPAVGNLTFQSNGSFTYAFPTELVGSVAFTYKLSDGEDESSPATVTLTRAGLINAADRKITVIGSDASDLVRIQPAGRGSIRVEIVSATGMTSEVLQPSGLPFNRIEVRLGSGDDRLDAAVGVIPILVVGGAGNDALRTGRGPDKIFGDDEGVLENGAGTGSDVVDAGGGRNTIVAAAGDNIIRTGAGPDSITTGDGRQYIDSGAGNDVIRVRSGSSSIYAGAGNDDVSATGGANWFEGGAGNDVLVGGSDADALFGGAGKDLLAGGFGADLLDGGLGNDILFDGEVRTLSGIGPDSLAKVLASYVPTRRSSLVNITDRIEVTLDVTATDNLTGSAGIDWFWTMDALDVTDRLPAEPLNAVN